MDNSPIKFLEDTHQYINIETNEEYCSVSKLLGRYKEKFDAENISKWVAKKRGVSQEEILKEWEDAGAISFWVTSIEEVVNRLSKEGLL